MFLACKLHIHALSQSTTTQWWRTQIVSFWCSNYTNVPYLLPTNISREEGNTKNEMLAKVNLYSITTVDCVRRHTASSLFCAALFFSMILDASDHSWTAHLHVLGIFQFFFLFHFRFRIHRFGCDYSIDCLGCECVLHRITVSRRPRS